MNVTKEMYIESAKSLIRRLDNAGFYYYKMCDLTDNGYILKSERKLEKDPEVTMEKHMKHINNFKQFLFENVAEMTEVFGDADILESIVTDSDALLKSIRAEEVDWYTIFGLDKSNYGNDLQIEQINDDKNFNQALQKKKLQKNEIESTEEYQTFIEKTIDIKFFSVYGINDSELEKPDYIFFQLKRKIEKAWQPVKCYKVKENMRHFYDKLTSKTVEIKKDGKTYVYSTSNSGNDWNLKNIESKNDIFKDSMGNDDIKAILIDKNVSITIIS